MNSSGLQAFWRGEHAINAELQMLRLPRHRKKRALAQMGREVKKQSRKNVKNQSSTQGKRFKQRRKPRTRKGLMLSGLVKGANIRQRTKGNAITVGFKNAQMGRVANEHQEGITRTFNARKMSEQQKADWRTEPASMAQANAIMRFGYRWRERDKDGKRKKISRRYIVENLTKWQALGLLNELKHGKGGRKGGVKSWQTVLPSREFFSNDTQWVKQMAHDVMKAELSRGK
ncbi:hypothetical protein [Marinomonas posidonica]|uniref:hypothetical protein n=1 Tax=Marinomonas posidonica TaxID=936476 RepID=UPI0037368637